MLFETRNEIDIRERSPLALAFVGDGVFELLVRAKAVETTRLTPKKLHSLAVRFVSAKGQFAALSLIEPMLTEEEANIVRRGHNASKATVAKHATCEEYRASTGLEALFGYLYLLGEYHRVNELFEIISSM